MYYHVSYWGFPHDYLWLCTTPPSLIQEEMTKAYDHGVRRYWILNVGDLKPAEADIDCFLQLAWNEPAMAQIDQKTFLERWLEKQFPTAVAPRIAQVMQHYYQLNFIRKPEFMGFNGYDDGVKRTKFNPYAWPANRPFGQNGARVRAWRSMVREETVVARALPSAYRNAYFQLVRYPVEASAAQNDKFLFTDRSFLDAAEHHQAEREADAKQAHTAYNRIQDLTVEYNNLESGKWDGMMSDAPRNREVFKMPITATATDASLPLPASWGHDHTTTPSPPPNFTGFVEQHGTVSINSTHFIRKSDGAAAHWNLLPDLGISGGSIVYGSPGILAHAPAESCLRADPAWLEYEFTTTTSGPATLRIHLLPTFPVDSAQRLRFAIAIDGNTPETLDLAGGGEWQEGNAPTWELNVRRNSAIFTMQFAEFRPGHHTLRLIYEDPGIVFEHLVLSFAGAPPAYPVPPETRPAP